MAYHILKSIPCPVSLHTPKLEYFYLLVYSYIPILFSVDTPNKTLRDRNKKFAINNCAR